MEVTDRGIYDNDKKRKNSNKHQWRNLKIKNFIR